MFSGSGGCNNYTGDYTAIPISPIASSMNIGEVAASLLCDNVMIAELDYFISLPTTIGYTLNQNNLILTTEEDPLVFSMQ